MTNRMREPKDVLNTLRRLIIFAKDRENLSGLDWNIYYSSLPSGDSDVIYGYILRISIFVNGKKYGDVSRISEDQVLQANDSDYILTMVVEDIIANLKFCIREGIFDNSIPRDDLNNESSRPVLSESSENNIKQVLRRKPKLKKMKK